MNKFTISETLNKNICTITYTFLFIEKEETEQDEAMQHSVTTHSTFPPSALNRRRRAKKNPPIMSCPCPIQRPWTFPGRSTIY